MVRATAILGGLAALAAFAFALWATSAGSVIAGLGKAVVLALAGGGIAAARGGLNVELPLGVFTTTPDGRWERLHASGAQIRDEFGAASAIALRGEVLVVG